MKKVLLSLLISLMIPVSMWSGTTGKLTGTITDGETGEPLPFVNVILLGTNIGGATDLDGKYVILNIPPGKYTVKVQAVGFTTKVVENVSISIDLTTKLDAVLTIEDVELGEVVVQAEAGGIQKDVTSSQSLVSSETIENLPVAELDDVLQLQAGITKGAGGEFHIRGGRAEEIAFKVNGISVTDSYDNSRGIDIDNSSVQELQVISGTFNAEHGDALSGIINTVTKEGKSKYHGDIKIYSADYLSNNTEIFTNIDAINPMYNFQGSLSGPIPGLGDDFRFFVNGRYVYDDGWLYGKRVFNTMGDSSDGDYVAMNWSERIMSIANLSWFASSAFKFNLEALYSKNDYQDYDHAYKWNPDGNVNKYSTSLSSTLTMTHTFSSSSFYTLKASYFNRQFDEYLYENELDSRYLHPDSLNTVSYAFIHAGTNLHRFARQTNSFLGKFDFTSQVHENHLVKFGIEARFDKLEFDDFYLEPETVNNVPVEPFVPSVPEETSPNREKYDADPMQMSAYIQDKIEFESVIINIGLRFDYFDSRGQILVDYTDPNIYIPLRDELKDLSVAEREPYFYKDASAKWKLAPRFGIAYPISATGVVHFSYGQFFQIPTYQRLFDRSSYKIPTTGNPGSVYGNPDLEPQTTTMYEIGFRQEFSNLFLVDLTMFYRDIRDYVTSGPSYETRNGVAYSLFINRAYANVKGVTLDFKKEYSDYFSFDFNYTFQFAEGINSTPEEDFYASRDNTEPTYYLLPLDWDQRHIINASLYVGEDTWGATLLGRYGTGLPYTPSVTQATADRGLTSGFSRNTRRRPNQFSLDLRLFKTFEVFGQEVTTFFRVFNLLDTKIIVNVFSDTGLADFTTEAQSLEGVEDPNRPNTIEEYLIRPWHYDQPRRVQVGFDVAF